MSRLNDVFDSNENFTTIIFSSDKYLITFINPSAREGKGNLIIRSTDDTEKELSTVMKTSYKKLMSALLDYLNKENSTI